MGNNVRNEGEPLKKSRIRRIINAAPLVKRVLWLVYCFLFEYITNHVVGYIPCVLLRWLYYRYVLGIRMERSVYIYMGLYWYPTDKKVVIGRNTAINRKVVMDARDDVYIGNNVNISAEAAIYIPVGIELIHRTLPIIPRRFGSRIACGSAHGR